jgi:GH15 family glucan-1,4-alpha-glucosidase
LVDGLVRRYRTDVADVAGADTHPVDGLPPGEGVFLPCSFWLADVYVQLDRADEARSLFERLLGLRNDVGLLSEEYEPGTKRLLGNFPQAFSHLSLINTAYNLTVHPDRPAHHRAKEPSPARATRNMRGRA